MEGVDVGEVVAAVHLDGLQETHYHPRPEENQVVSEYEEGDEEARAKDWRRWRQ